MQDTTTTTTSHVLSAFISPSPTSYFLFPLRISFILRLHT